MAKSDAKKAAVFLTGPRLETPQQKIDRFVWALQVNAQRNPDLKRDGKGRDARIEKLK